MPMQRWRQNKFAPVGYAGADGWTWFRIGSGSAPADRRRRGQFAGVSRIQRRTVGGYLTPRVPRPAKGAVLIRDRVS